VHLDGYNKKIMKKLIIALLLVFGCNIDSRDRYRVYAIDQSDGKLVTYHLENWRNEHIIDTSGKYKIGDTVFIKMVKK